MGGGGGGEGRGGLWDVLDSLIHQPTMTFKMEPGIGVPATVIAPKEQIYLGQPPTFTRPFFVPSIIPSLS